MKTVKFPINYVGIPKNKQSNVAIIATTTIITYLIIIAVIFNIMRVDYDNKFMLQSINEHMVKMELCIELTEKQKREHEANDPIHGLRKSLNELANLVVGGIIDASSSVAEEVGKAIDYSNMTEKQQHDSDNGSYREKHHSSIYWEGYLSKGGNYAEWKKTYKCPYCSWKYTD